MQRHEGHEALVVAARVGVGHQRDLLQEEVEGVVLGAGVELARDLDQLLEVLDAPLRLDRALGLERVEVAGLVQDRVEQVADRDLLLGALAQEGHRGHEALEGPDRRRAEPGHLAREAAASHTGMPIVSAWLSTRDSDVCPIPRRGELATRVNETTSCGLASTVR